MKVTTELLKGFLRKVCMDKDASVRECILKFENNGLKIVTSVASNVVMVDGFLDKSKIEDYEAIGSIGVDDLSFISKCLDRFQADAVTIKKQENFLVISDNQKKIEFVLTDTEFMDKPPVLLENLVHDISLNLNYEKFKDFLSDVSAIGASKIAFKTSANKKLLLKADSMKYHLESEVDVPVSVDNLNVEFTELFVGVVQNLTGDLKVGLKNSYPLLLDSSFEGGYVKILMAPIS